MQTSPSTQPRHQTCTHHCAMAVWNATVPQHRMHNTKPVSNSVQCHIRFSGLIMQTSENGTLSETALGLQQGTHSVCGKTVRNVQSPPRPSSMASDTKMTETKPRSIPNTSRAMIRVSAHPHACFMMTAGAFAPLGILAVGDFDLMAELFSRAQARMDSDVRTAKKLICTCDLSSRFVTPISLALQLSPHICDDS